MLKTLFTFLCLLSVGFAHAAPLKSIKCAFNSVPRSNLTLTLSDRVGSYFSVIGTAVFFVKIEELELETPNDIRTLKHAVIDHWAIGQQCELKVLKNKTLAGCAPYGQMVTLTKIDECVKYPQL